MYFFFSERLRSINASTWLQLQLVYFVCESHEGSNLAPLTKEESMETSDMYLFFLFYMCRFFTYNAQTSNVGRKDIGLNCHGLLWAEMAMGRIDKRLLFADKISDSQ